MHLCAALPPPACFIYQEMTPKTLQHLIAQRSVVEKKVREHQEELRWQLKRLRGWLEQVGGGKEGERVCVCGGGGEGGGMGNEGACLAGGGAVK